MYFLFNSLLYKARRLFSFLALAFIVCFRKIILLYAIQYCITCLCSFGIPDDLILYRFFVFAFVIW